MKYVALFRGLNVGGKGLVKMSDLKLCFEQAGFKNVSTYIQSGNVIFESTIKNNSTLCRKIEQIFTKRFKFNSPVVIVSSTQFDKIIKQSPRGFGSSPLKYRYNVIFLRSHLDANKILPLVAVNSLVDKVAAGPQVLYFSHLMAKASQSRLSKIVSQPFYKDITIRNWNSTTKLLYLMKV